MTEHMHDEHPGTEELARRLDAYAAARLSPSRPAVLRMRAHVVEAAHGRARDDSPGWRLAPLRRRLTALALAATLAIAGAAVVSAASMPGGPLYEPRLWLEQLTLPSDPSARTQARIDEIAERLADANAALQSRDAHAIAAALSAYEDAVDAALQDAGSDAARLSHLRDALGRHVTVLEGLRTTVPSQAGGAIDRALEESQKAVDRIDKGGTNARPSPEPGTTPKPGRGNGSSGTPSLDSPAMHDEPAASDGSGATNRP